MENYDMQRNNFRSRLWGRALEVALLGGAAALVLGNLFGSAKRTRRDRRQQVEALRRWEGEGGTVNAADDTAPTMDSQPQTTRSTGAPQQQG
jgi:hypothetical protein